MSQQDPDGDIEATNPLLWEIAFPAYGKMEAQHIAPALSIRLASIEEGLQALEQQEAGSWEGFFVPLQQLEASLWQLWRPLQLLCSVRYQRDWKAAVDLARPAVMAMARRIYQSQALYKGCRGLLEDASAGLDAHQRRALQQWCEESEREGASLSPEARAAHDATHEALEAQKQRFTRHLGEAIESTALVVTDPAHVAGLSGQERLHAAEETYYMDVEGRFAPGAISAHAGPWTFTIATSSYQAVMRDAHYRPLRARLYQAYQQAASAAPRDNHAVIAAILSQRQALAQEAGAPHYAALRHGSAAQVDALDRWLSMLTARCRRLAQDDLGTLRTWAATQGANDQIAPWDLEHWRHRWQTQGTRPRFSLAQTLLTLRGLCRQWLGLVVRPSMAPCDANAWHPDVQCYEVLLQETHEPIGLLSLDLFARPLSKEGGAWTEEGQPGDTFSTPPMLPLAHIICNFAPPDHALHGWLDFQALQVLFHEWGHALHQILSATPSPPEALPWQLVEYPSQLMERWSQHAPTLASIGAASGLEEAACRGMLRRHQMSQRGRFYEQLRLACVDLALHQHQEPAAAIEAAHAIAATTSLFEGHRDLSLCTFHHIFSGRYAATYASYAWSQACVLRAALPAVSGSPPTPEEALTARRTIAPDANQINTLSKSPPDATPLFAWLAGPTAEGTSEGIFGVE